MPLKLFSVFGYSASKNPPSKAQQQQATGNININQPQPTQPSFRRKRNTILLRTVVVVGGGAAVKTLDRRTKSVLSSSIIIAFIPFIMSARGDNNFMRYVYMGQEGERIPRGATHIMVHESVTVICTRTFLEHPNIVEVICHDNVEKIEEHAFYSCISLRRVIMLGVTIIEEGAFGCCGALTNVECGKLEIVGEEACCYCLSLRSINLPSARVVERYAFASCEALTEARSIGRMEK